MKHEEAKEGSDQAYANATRHLSVSELLAKKKEFGVATAHLVLAAEECVKSFMLYFYWLKLIPLKNLKPFLYSHRPRHIFLSQSLIVGYPMRMYVSEMLILQKQVNRKNISGSEAKAVVLTNLTNWLKGGHKSDDTYYKLVEWCKSADHMKRQGLYVDFNHDKWTGPDAVSKEEYKNSLYVCKHIFDMFGGVFSLDRHQEEELAKFYKQMKSDFIQNLIDDGFSAEQASAIFNK